MKNRFIALLLCMSMAGTAMGCGAKGNDDRNNEAEATEAVEELISQLSSGEEHSKEAETETQTDADNTSGTDAKPELTEVHVTRYSAGSELFMCDSDEFYKNLMLTSIDAKLALAEKGEYIGFQSEVWNEKIEGTIASLKESGKLSDSDKEKLDEIEAQWSDFDTRYRKLWGALYDADGYIHGSMYREMETDVAACKYELFEGALMALEYEVTGSNKLTLSVLSEDSDLSSVQDYDFEDVSVCMEAGSDFMEMVEETGLLTMGEHEWRNIAADSAKIMKEIGSEESDGSPYVVNYVRLTKLMNELEESVSGNSDKALALREHRFKLLAIEMLNLQALMLRDVEGLADGDVMNAGFVDEAKECYHIGIQRPYEVEGEYYHFFDCFFADGTYTGVFYPSKKDDVSSDRYVNSGCDFSCEYIDVTFDGHGDIVISLGAAGNCLVHCAYVYDNGEFSYVKSFENIPDYRIDEEAQCITGMGYDGSEHSYIYDNGEFVEK